MLAPVNVVNSHVKTEQYPEKEQRKHRKLAKKKPKPKIRYQQDKDGTHIDFTI